MQRFCNPLFTTILQQRSGQWLAVMMYWTQWRRNWPQRQYTSSTSYSTMKAKECQRWSNWQNSLCKSPSAEKIGERKCSFTDPHAADSLESRLKKNFWKMCRDIFKDVISHTPSFDVTASTKYFTGVLEWIGAVRRFKMPTWIPLVPAATKLFDVSPPTYKEVTKPVNRHRLSFSPCPLDEIACFDF